MNFLFSIQSVINTLTWLMHIFVRYFCAILYIFFPVHFKFFFFSFFWFIFPHLFLFHVAMLCMHIFWLMQIFYLLNCIRWRKCTHLSLSLSQCVCVSWRALCWSRDKNASKYVCRHIIVFGKKWDKRTKDIIESISIWRCFRSSCVFIRSKILALYEMQKKKNCMHKIIMHKTDMKKKEKSVAAAFIGDLRSIAHICKC